MTFWGFAVNYVIRTNINIAIVSMVKHTTRRSNITVVSECLIESVSLKLNNNTADKASKDLYDVSIIQQLLFRIPILYRYLLG